MMAAAAEPALVAGTFIRRATGRNPIDVVGADVLTPFPDVARHVIEAKLIWLLQADVVGVRGPFQDRPPLQAPGEPPPDRAAHEIASNVPARTVPRNSIRVVAAAEGVVDRPVRPAARRVFPLGLRRQAEAQ